MDILNRLETYAKVLSQEPMRKHTTYHIGGNVDYYIYPNDILALMNVVDLLKEQQIPFHVLGRGSNVLFGDEPYHGAIINLDKTFNDYYIEENGKVTVQAGCSIINLAVETAKRGLSGLEFASGIPGSVGGALFMNAGAYKSDMSAVVTEVCVYKDNSIVWLSKEQLEFAYRHSIFQKQRDWVILACRMQLKPANVYEVQALIESRRQRRIASQPLDKPCAGSVFRNPKQMPAWKIIDEMGYRGYQIGGARISDKHSNFIVNENDQATAHDVMALIDMIKTQAKKEFDIDLITEVEQLNWKK